MLHLFSEGPIWKRSLATSVAMLLGCFTIVGTLLLTSSLVVSSALNSPTADKSEPTEVTKEATKTIPKGNPLSGGRDKASGTHEES